MKKKNAFLHIGKHKTGSTSIQKYLADNIGFFRVNGFDVILNSIIPSSMIKTNPANCAGLAHLFIRDDLETPVRLRGNFIYNDEERVKVVREAKLSLYRQESEKIIISAEAFSFFRMQSELEALYDFLDVFRVVPIFFYRDPVSWMRSWELQLIPLRRKLNILNPRSEGIFDFRPNSWLLDDDAIVDLFGEQTIALSYDEHVERDGSVIPMFLRSLGLSPKDCPAWDGVWCNDSASKPRIL